MKRLCLILAAVAVAALFLLPLRVRQDLGWIDAISGSRKSQTVLLGGASTSPLVSQSPLAARYHRLGLQWEPDWCNIKGTYLNVFGGNVGHAHGPAPELYSFALNPDLQQCYLAVASDDEIRQLFRVLSSGTAAEKKAAVEAVSDRALSNYPATRPADNPPPQRTGDAGG